MLHKVQVLLSRPSYLTAKYIFLVGSEPSYCLSSFCVSTSCFLYEDTSQKSVSATTGSQNPIVFVSWKVKAYRNPASPVGVFAAIAPEPCIRDQVRRQEKEDDAQQDRLCQGALSASCLLVLLLGICMQLSLVVMCPNTDILLGPHALSWLGVAHPL